MTHENDVENTDLTTSPVPAPEAQPASETCQPAGNDSLAEQAETSQDSFENETQQVPFTAEGFEMFKNLAKEIKLSPDQVDKLLAFQQDYANKQTQSAQARKREEVEDWANQTRAAYGEKLDREISFALRAANVFGGPELRALLEQTGLGNHPVIIRTLSGIGKTISEDASLGGRPSAPQDKTFAEALYGSKN